MLGSIIAFLTSLIAITTFTLDRVVPNLGSLPLLKTRRGTRRMMASGYNVDYAGRWRYGLGEHSTVTRSATPAELKYLGITPSPIDGHRELTGGL
jgi:hypothetical protein